MTIAKQLLSAVLYTSLALCATPVVAADRDLAALSDMRAGDMRKLIFTADPAPAPTTPFVDANGDPLDLSAFRGKVILLNFWATWCAPCREEMPALNMVQTTLGGDRFAVVTVATGRNPPPIVKRFFDGAGVDALPAYRDPKQALARAMSVFGLPMSVVLDEDGNEIARLRGDAAWDQPEALDMLRAIIATDS